jgi:HAE1 family hydrophobic/amphiphilic exporter-1
MNVAEPFIRRPVMTALVMIAILVFGILGYRELAVNDLPNVDYPTVQVNADLPGASPETMASAVATPLEKQFSTIAGLDSMTSSSSQGSTQVTLQFNLSRNVDAAAQDVQAAIARTSPELPQNMPSPPTYQKVNPADQPVLYMSLSSQTLPLSDVDEYAETLMAQRISTVSGVARVSVYGSQKYAVRVQLDPRLLASRGIGIDEVSQAVSNANVNLPTGTLWGPDKAFTVQASGQLMRAPLYRPLIVAYRAGSPVRLDELGQIFDSVEDDKTAGWYRDERAVVLAIQRQPGTNTVEVVDNIKALIPSFRSVIPSSVNMAVLYDSAETIRASVADVKFTLYLAVILVVMVIFIFLRNLSATLIPSIALPMSIVGTFAVMYELGYTLDNLSLMALTLSVGFVVDDAIVMLENIVRHMEMGEPVMQAALNGAREVGFTIVSMTISLAAVFIPVLFLGGILGRLLHEFAIVISVAILVSGFVSLTLTPMLCSRFLRPPGEKRHGRIYESLERFFNGMLRGYDSSLQWVMRHRLATMGVSALILAVTIWQFMIIPKGFLPAEDNNNIFSFTEAQQGISFDSMRDHQEELNRIVLADPNVIDFFSTTIGGNSGIIFFHLKNRAERTGIVNPTFQSVENRTRNWPVVPAILRTIRPMFIHRLTIDEVIEELRPKLSSVPGIIAFMQNLPPIQIGGELTKSPYQFTLTSPDTETLYSASNNLLDRMRQIPQLQDVTTDLQIANPQVNVNIDRDKASAVGVSAAQVEDALYTAYGQRQVSTIFAPNNEYRVIMELLPQFQLDPQALSLLYIHSANNGYIPLSTVANLVTGLGPLSVNHRGQLPAVTISFNTKPGVALGDALPKVNQLAREVLPQDITPSFQGSAEAFQSSLKGLGLLLLMAVLVIYIVLGILYESFIHPITILSGLPSAAFGALLTLQIFHLSLDLYGFVGIIMLIGIVKKNAIMMVDFAVAYERDRHETAAEAIYQGCLVRFRPIMMTTMAALMGTLPIAIGFGAGADSRRPLGLVVVGGLIFSQLVTLYLTPVFYTYMDGFQDWLGGMRVFRGAAEKPRREPSREPADVVAD